MPNKTKNLRDKGQKEAQARRCDRNKTRRIIKNKSYKTGTKNPGHILALLKRRLPRLERAFKKYTGDKERQLRISKRIDEVKVLIA